MHELNGNTFSFGNVELAQQSNCKIELVYHKYRYFPYERELARREVEKAAFPSKILLRSSSIQLHGCVDLERLRSLTYVAAIRRSEEHTSELQSRRDLVCRLLLEKK